MKTVSKIALTAGILLTLSFTFSCSDDDDKKGGGWLTCEELESLLYKCDSKYSAETAACKNINDDKKQDDCFDAVDAKMFEECTKPDACNGTSKMTCGAHYQSACPDLFEN